MKVTVYETFENMRTSQYPIEIDNVTRVDESKVGGLAVLAEDKSYMFPSNVFAILEE